MARPVYVLLTNPVEGREREFDDWYTNVHLREVLTPRHVPERGRGEA